MANDITFLLVGLALGVIGAIKPGPLLTLIISETLKYNVKEGIKVAVAPLLTDIPIILFVFLILNKLAKSNLVIGTIAIVGSLYLLYLAYQNIFFKEVKLEKITKSNSIKKGVITNFLNPYPYIFWIFIGGPIIVKSLEVSILAPIIFIIAFYFSAIGVMIAIVFIVQKLRNFLKTKTYIYLVRILGFVLLIFAFIFLREGLIRIRVI